MPKWKMILGIVALVLLAAVVVVWRQLRVTPAPASPGSSASTPGGSAPPVLLESFISGNVLSISPVDRTMTVGTYRLEGGRAVLASQRTARFDAETRFVRQVPSSGQQEPTQEVPMTSSDIKQGDLVRIIPVTGATGDTSLSQKIILLYLPAPSSSR